MRCECGSSSAEVRGEIHIGGVILRELGPKVRGVVCITVFGHGLQWADWIRMNATQNGQRRGQQGDYSVYSIPPERVKSYRRVS